MPKPDHVHAPVFPPSPRLDQPRTLATQEDIRAALLVISRYQQQQTVWLQQTFTTIQRTLASMGDAINYILDQLP